MTVKRIFWPLRVSLRMSRRAITLTPYIPVILLVLLGAQIFFAATLLQPYIAITREKVVAEVIMSPIQNDAGGNYIEIEFIPFEYPSAWDTARGADDASHPPVGEATIYKLYGDTVAIRGPLVALHNLWRVLGFENVYQLAIIEGEYRLPGSSDAEGTEFYINGGVDASWWDRNAQEARFPHNTVIKRITLSGDEEFGFVGQRRKRYEIVVTADAITWNFVEFVD